MHNIQYPPQLATPAPCSSTVTQGTQDSDLKVNTKKETRQLPPVF